MWSHVILPNAVLPPPGLRLYWTDRYTWRLATDHQQSYLSDAGDFNPVVAGNWIAWRDNLGGNTGLTYPLTGNVFVDGSGRIWIYGRGEWGLGTVGTNERWWALRWDSALRQMIRAWQVDRPAAHTLFGRTQTYGGIIGACNAPDNHIYAVVICPTTTGLATEVGQGVVVRYSGAGDGGTASSVQDSAQRGDWRRAAVLVGSLYGPQTCIRAADWDGITTPEWAGLIFNLIEWHDGTHDVDYVYGLALGTVQTYLDDPPYVVQANPVFALLRAPGGSADDANAWTDLLLVASRHDLAIATTAEYTKSFGPARPAILQALAFAGRIWWTWGLAWDTATGNTPHHTTIVWCQDGFGTLQKFDLPPAVLGGHTCHWGPYLAVVGSDLWMATVEGGSASDNTTLTLRMWRFIFGTDPILDPDSWSNTLNWERPIGDWDGASVITMAGDPDGKVHLLMDSDSHGGPLKRVEEIIYDPALPPPVGGDPDLRFVAIDRGTPTGSHTTNWGRHFIEWEA